MITFTAITQLADRTWKFDWTATAASSYRVVLFGDLLDTVTDPTYTTDFPGWETYPPPLEVTENAGLAESEKYKPYAILQWYEVPAAADYQLDELVGAAWTRRAQVAENGLPVYSVKTARLTDDTSHTYRVVANTGLVTSVARTFGVFVNTPPVLDETKIRVTWSKPALQAVVASV